jgi:hypothetical protein
VPQDLNGTFTVRMAVDPGRFKLEMPETTKTIE